MVELRNAGRALLWVIGIWSVTVSIYRVFWATASWLDYLVLILAIVFVVARFIAEVREIDRKQKLGHTRRKTDRT